MPKNLSDQKLTNLSDVLASNTRKLKAAQKQIRTNPFPGGFTVLPLGTADPVAATLNGSMYYNVTTDEVRVLKAGTWRDVITT